MPSLDLHPAERYPCPCGQCGQLKPIALTEAFGCDRCAHTFAISPVIRQRLILLTGCQHDDPPSWVWDGTRWSPATVRGRVRFHAGAILAVLLSAVVGLAFALNLGWGSATVLWMGVVLALAVLPAALVWLASRR